MLSSDVLLLDDVIFEVDDVMAGGEDFIDGGISGFFGSELLDWEVFESDGRFTDWPSRLAASPGLKTDPAELLDERLESDESLFRSLTREGGRRGDFLTLLPTCLAPLAEE
jgi:hypothetical protein